MVFTCTATVALPLAPVAETGPTPTCSTDTLVASVVDQLKVTMSPGVGTEAGVTVKEEIFAAGGGGNGSAGLGGHPVARATEAAMRRLRVVVVMAVLSW
ncbi:MAG: hypothetical protein AMXMBFR34_43850 [Myxococcaceae bacterium]